MVAIKLFDAIIDSISRAGQFEDVINEWLSSNRVRVISVSRAEWGQVLQYHIPGLIG